jgi:hypothetical protein
MNILRLLIVILAIAAPASGQVLDTQYLTATSASCGTAGSCATFDVGNAAALSFTVSGTFSATLTFEGTADGVTWTSANASTVTDTLTATATTTTTTGVYTVGNIGFLKLRVRCSAYTSGAARVSATRGQVTPANAALVTSDPTLISVSDKAMVVTMQPAVLPLPTSLDAQNAPLRIADSSNNDITAGSDDYTAGISALYTRGVVAPGARLDAFTCSLDNIATTRTQCQAAPAAGKAIFITDVVAMSTTATAGQFALAFGTGSNCGTGTGNVLPSSTATARIPAAANNGAGPTVINFGSPLKVPTDQALCVLGVATNTVTIQISGFIQ